MKVFLKLILKHQHLLNKFEHTNHFDLMKQIFEVQLFY